MHPGVRGEPITQGPGGGIVTAAVPQLGRQKHPAAQGGFLPVPQKGAQKVPGVPGTHLQPNPHIFALEPGGLEGF